MNALEVFISGLRKGAAIGIRFMLPALIATFVVIEMLQVSGVLRLLAEHVSGVMAVFGLPGEALAVLIAAWASAAGAIGMVAGLAFLWGRSSSFSDGFWPLPASQASACRS